MMSSLVSGAGPGAERACRSRAVQRQGLLSQAHHSFLVGSQGLSLEQSVSQFSNTMTAQADLRVEAAHLRRFLHNFRALSASITAPRPVVRPLSVRERLCSLEAQRKLASCCGHPAAPFPAAAGQAVASCSFCIVKHCPSVTSMSSVLNCVL